MYIHSWHPVPLRKIPCLSGHLLFLPIRQLGLALGTASRSFPGGLLLPYSPGCRGQVPSSHPQRGPGAQALALGGPEAGLRMAGSLTGVNSSRAQTPAKTMERERGSFRWVC